MTDAVKKPDPGNSEPEGWSEPLSEEEQQEVRDLLGVENGDGDAESGR